LLSISANVQALQRQNHDDLGRLNVGGAGYQIFMHCVAANPEAAQAKADPSSAT
jgi:hypothetical protein